MSSILNYILPGLATRNLINNTGIRFYGKKRWRSKYYSVKVKPGEWAKEGNKLVKQRGLKYHPGLNVGVGIDRVLYALTEGKVVISVEKVNPMIEGNPLGQLYYEDRLHENIYKWFFHVIPPPQPKKFKLVAAL